MRLLPFPPPLHVARFLVAAGPCLMLLQSKDRRQLCTFNSQPGGEIGMEQAAPIGAVGGGGGRGRGPSIVRRPASESPVVKRSCYHIAGLPACRTLRWRA